MGGLEADRLSDGDTSRLFGFCKADSRLDEGGRSKVWDRLRVDVRVLSLVDRSSPVSVGRDLRIDFPGTHQASTGLLTRGELEGECE